LLVAVMVAEAVATGVGAVYTPAAVIAPTEADQVTPALAESFVTVAAKVCVAPAASVALAGLIATLITGAGGVLLPPPQPATRVNARKPAERRASRRKDDMD
jgi:hypothetical protein